MIEWCLWGAVAVIFCYIIGEAFVGLRQVNEQIALSIERWADTEDDNNDT